jgi:hypothetical protein
MASESFLKFLLDSVAFEKTTSSDLFMNFYKGGISSKVCIITQLIKWISRQPYKINYKEFEEAMKLFALNCSDVEREQLRYQFLFMKGAFIADSITKDKTPSTERRNADIQLMQKWGLIGDVIPEAFLPENRTLNSMAQAAICSFYHYLADLTIKKALENDVATDETDRALEILKEVYDEAPPDVKKDVEILTLAINNTVTSNQV